MAYTIAIINQKGGVGKSTTAQALGAGLSLKGKRTLVIDIDPQCNTSFSLGARTDSATVLGVLLEETSARDAIQHCDSCDVLSGSKRLSSADKILTEVGSEFMLREAIEPIADEYDYIVIDTPPMLGILTTMALTACNSVVIPVQADYYSLQGILDLSDTIKAVKKRCNPSLTISGILFTMYDSRSSFTAELTELAESIATKLETSLFDNAISRCIAIRKAQINSKSIYAYDSRCKAAQEYSAFTDELISKIGGK